MYCAESLGTATSVQSGLAARAQAGEVPRELILRQKGWLVRPFAISRSYLVVPDAGICCVTILSTSPAWMPNGRGGAGWDLSTTCRTS